jgi:hypothetical protein
VLAIDRLLAEATPRMLPMISLARIRPRAARTLVEIANGRPWRALRRRPEPAMIPTDDSRDRRSVHSR